MFLSKVRSKSTIRGLEIALIIYLGHRNKYVVSRREISALELKMTGKNAMFAAILTLGIAWGIYGQKEVMKVPAAKVVS